MSYTALYRKFRPGGFEDVKGQEHIITAIKNQIKSDRVGHAYLFCGTRGTGKTTVAKILGKAVNCETPIDGSPCGNCEMCVEISTGASLNLIEIDAASNNGVEDIRTIKKEVDYRPTKGKYKVYIIDEVHMLTDAAYNALLKTLEEPPEYVLFILATTELHKIPVTILSRCQHYDFKRITVDTISNRLFDLMSIEGIEVEDKAIRYIAKAADGSMRDALSLIEQCIAFHMGHGLTYDHVLEVLGAVDTDTFSRLMRQILGSNLSGALATVEELIMSGHEVSHLVNNFVWYVRNLLLLKSTDGMGYILDVSSENLSQLKEEAQLVSEGTLVRYIRVLSELSNQLKQATQKRVLLEVAIIKLCKPQMELNLEDLTHRVEKVEDKIEQGVFTTVANGNEVVEEEEPEVIIVEEAIPEEVKEVARNYLSIVDRVDEGLIRAYLKEAKICLGSNDELKIVLANGFAFEHFNKDENVDKLGKAIIDFIGKKVEISVAYGGEVSGKKAPDIRTIIAMPIGEE